jgi:hypothetical protein
MDKTARLWDMLGTAVAPSPPASPTTEWPSKR